MYIPERQENAELVCCISTHLFNKGPNSGLCIVALGTEKRAKSKLFFPKMFKRTFHSFPAQRLNNVNERKIIMPNYF